MDRYDILLMLDSIPTQHSTVFISLHKIEILGAIGNDLSDFSSDVHPESEADVKVPGSSFSEIRCEDNEVTISLYEVLRHLLPERFLQFWFKIEFLLSPDNTFSQIL